MKNEQSIQNTIKIEPIINDLKDKLTIANVKYNATKVLLNFQKKEIEKLTIENTSLKSELNNSIDQYNQLLNKHYSVINSKTWRIGQLTGRLVGIESFWRMAIKRFLNNSKKTQVVNSYDETKCISSANQEIKGKDELYDLFIFPIVDFSFRQQRPHHISKGFAKKGHRVFYLNNSINLPLDEDLSYEIKTITENLYEVFLSYPNKLDVYGGEIDNDTFNCICSSLYDLKVDNNLLNVVAIVHNPFWTPIALAMKYIFGWKIIYDCIDEWSPFPGIGEYFMYQEQLLVREADIVTVTGYNLQKKWSKYKQDIPIVRNACDYEFFSKPSNKDILGEIKRPIIGFFGAIEEWVEIDHIKYAAINRQDWSFVIVGYVTVPNVIEEFKEIKNVFFVGEKPYETMRDYLYNFDVCIIPFKKNEITEAVDPVKLYEYLTLGKPVVARNLYEVEIYKEIIYLYNTEDDFVKAIEQALLEKSHGHKQKRIEVAKENTWNDRINQFDKIIKESF